MKKQRAFTLVELLVVISIIALLLAVLMPALQKAREQGRSVVCRSGVSQLIKGFLIYGQDNKDRLPSYGNYENYTDPSTWWFCKVMAYLGDKNVTANRRFGCNFMRCPSTTAQKPKTDDFFAVVDRSVVPFTIGVYYPKVISWESTNPAYVGNQYYQGGARISKLKSSQFVAGDCRSGYTWQSCIGDPSNPNWLFTKDTDGDGVLDSAPGELRPGYGMGQYNGLAPRHFKSASTVYIDGSARTLSVKDWATNKGNIW